MSLIANKRESHQQASTYLLATIGWQVEHKEREKCYPYARQYEVNSVK